MTSTEQQCPQQNRLVDYLMGKLPETELEQYADHISDCQICEDTIRGLDVRDTYSDLAGSAFEALFDDGSQDQQLVNQLISQMKCPSADATRAFDADARKLEDRAAEVTRQLDPPRDPESIAHLAHYRILSLIGAGSTGVVYRAVDTNLDRIVALKVLRPSLGDTARERFLAEARLAASIEHPNVVTIYHVGIEGHLAFMAMQWVPGETLEDRMKKQSVLTEEKLCHLGKQIAAGLVAAHARNLIHRDIKPANIWIAEETEEAKILDFGLARIADDDPQMTATGMLAGTPNFMSPEQTRGLELDGRSDLFSLGCLLYRAATGKLPFAATGILATLQAIQNDVPREPAQLNPNLSGDFSSLVMRLLEKHPVNRPDNARQLLQELETPGSVQFAPRKSIENTRSAKPDSGRSPLIKTASAGWGRWLTIAALLIGLGGAGWFFGPQIIRIVTDQGELVIESDDKDVEIQVLDDGRQVAVIDNQTNFRMDIKSGKYDLQVKGDGNTFELSKDQVTLKRGGREIVSITRLPPPVTGESNRVIQIIEDATGDQILIGDQLFPRREVQQELNRVFGINVELDPANLESELERLMGAVSSSSESETLAKLMQGAAAQAQETREIAGSQQAGGQGIRQRTTIASSTTQRPAKMYKGKNYREWKTMLLAETSAEAIAEGLNAVATLTSNDPQQQDDMINQLITPLMRQHGSRIITGSANEVGYLVEPLVKSFRHCEPPRIIDFVINEIKDGNAKSRDTLVFFFNPSYVFDYSLGAGPIQQYQSALVDNVPRITRAVIDQVATHGSGKIDIEQARETVRLTRVFQSLMGAVKPRDPRNQFHQFMEPPKSRTVDLASPDIAKLLQYIARKHDDVGSPSINMLTALMVMQLQQDAENVEYVAWMATNEQLHPLYRVLLVDSLAGWQMSDKVFEYLTKLYEENDDLLTNAVREIRTYSQISTIRLLVLDVLQFCDDYDSYVPWLEEQIKNADASDQSFRQRLELLLNQANASRKKQEEDSAETSGK